MEPDNTAFKPWGMEEKSFLMLLHLSQLAGFIIPFGGIIMPVVMWATTKDQSRDIDAHGRVILNWVISSIIYAIICVILMFLFIGFILIVILGIVAVVFAVIGAIKADKGELWPYPLSITFFRSA